MKIAKLATITKIKPVQTLPIVAVVAIIGSILLIRSFAAINGVISAEAEAGNLSGDVSMASDSTASGGKYILVRPSGSVTPTPPPTATPPPSTTPCTTEESTSCAGTNSDGAFFRETFTATSSGPRTAMNDYPRWYAQPTMQGTMGWDFAPQPMHGQHGPDCAPPPASHMVTTFADTVFLCKDHIMTNVNPPGGGTASGIVALKPNHLVDLSKGEASIKFDISTDSPSAGDWWEVWVTPWNDQLISPSDHWYHHAGPPRFAVMSQVRDYPPDNSKRWTPMVFNNYSMAISEFTGDGTLAFWKGTNFRDKVPVSLTRRDTYEVRMTKTTVKLLVKSPQTNNQMVLVKEFSIPGGFPTNEGVVQLVHSNYEPEKNGKINCGACPDVTIPNTWHWDQVEINPAIPYKLIGTQEFQIVNYKTSNKINFKEAAPANARMLFNSQSNNNVVDLSFDNGSSWQRATPVRGPNGVAGSNALTHGTDLLTYTINVPQGSTSALIRGVNYCEPGCGAVIADYGVWMAQNFHIIAR